MREIIPSCYICQSCACSAENNICPDCLIAMADQCQIELDDSIHEDDVELLSGNVPETPEFESSISV